MKKLSRAHYVLMDKKLQDNEGFWKNKVDKGITKNNRHTKKKYMGDMVQTWNSFPR